MDPMMRALLADAVRVGASDLHLTVGCAPFFRMHGELVEANGPPLEPDDLRVLLYSLLAPEQVEAFDREAELCFSVSVPEVGFFRVTLYRQRGYVEAAIRVGASRVRPLQELGLPPLLQDVTFRSTGLVLITGSAGQGKTTTLNALVDFVNRSRRCKIVTVEDPIEYHHRNALGIVVQQEVGSDTRSFHRALVHVLRQDPDVIAIGEMRDLETISAALTAAETGHLVLATLHANDCPQTISRVVDVFPERQQQQVRLQLAMTLRAVVNQRLLPRADGGGRVLACSLLVGTPAIQNMIRENRLNQLAAGMETARAQGMILMDDMLRDFYQRAVITYDAAIAHATDPRRILAGPGPAPSELHDR